MTTILIILAGILVTGLLAYAIVNYIPRKLHWIISIILIALAAFLVYKINFEIQKPINFNKEKKVKYAMAKYMLQIKMEWAIKSKGFSNLRTLLIPSINPKAILAAFL